MGKTDRQTHARARTDGMGEGRGRTGRLSEHSAALAFAKNVYFGRRWHFGPASFPAEIGNILFRSDTGKKMGRRERIAVAAGTDGAPPPPSKKTLPLLSLTAVSRPLISRPHRKTVAQPFVAASFAYRTNEPACLPACLRTGCPLPCRTA